MIEKGNIIINKTIGLILVKKSIDRLYSNSTVTVEYIFYSEFTI